MVTNSVVDQHEIIQRINKIKDTVEAKTFPNVYLISADLTKEEMNDLYSHPKVKRHICCTKGEGFGSPLA